MKIGLAGLPMSGKTTVFNMASGCNAETRDYLVQSEDINTGVIKVPDERVEKLTQIYKPRKKVYSTIEFTDIPGISNKDKKAATKTLSHIRNCDAVMLVVRLFEDKATMHINNRIDPASDLEELIVEFICSDLEVTGNRIQKLHKDMKVVKKAEQVKELELLEKISQHLEEGRLMSELELNSAEMADIKGFRFLTLKPLLLIGNCSDDQYKLKQEDPLTAKLFEVASEKGLNPFLISAKTEHEISLLSDEEQSMFLEEYGIKTSAKDRLINMAYSVLNYISFLTVGEDEVRAWPLQSGTTAHKAAGKIHSDIERGFIRAEVTAYDDFMEKGSMNAVKSAGLSRLEGKDYIVKDGDIINFRFNV